MQQRLQDLAPKYNQNNLWAFLEAIVTSYYSRNHFHFIPISSVCRKCRMCIFLLEQEEMSDNIILLQFIICCRMRMGFQSC